MDTKKVYRIMGKTYDSKEYLWDMGCKYDSVNNCFVTIPMDKESGRYNELKTHCDAMDLKMIPRDLDKQCEKIQDILKRRNR